jgi:hypothetical protein
VLNCPSPGEDHLRLATCRSDNSSARDQSTELDGSRTGISMVLNKLILWVMVSHCRLLGPFVSRRGTRTAIDSPPPTAIKLSADQLRLSVLEGQNGTSMRATVILRRLEHVIVLPTIAVVGKMDPGVCWTRQALPTCSKEPQDLVGKRESMPQGFPVSIGFIVSCVCRIQVGELYVGKKFPKREKFRTCAARA